MKVDQKLRAATGLLVAATLILPLTTSGLAQAKPAMRNEDRVRLAEAFRMADKLGERIWSGWSKAPFAVLLVTPEHEFLIRHSHPSGEFTALGYDPLLKSEVHFRKRVFAPGLLATFPAVGGVSTIVVGQPENTEAKSSTRWVMTLFHEHFHQMQDSQPDFYSAANALGLARGDQTGMWMLNFPFPYESLVVNQQFSLMIHALREAVRAVEGKDFHLKLAAYLGARKRFQETLTVDDYKYFSFQVWKEGVARYTEYRIAREAGRHYRPSKEFASLKDVTPFSYEAGRTLDGIMADLENMSLEKRQRTAFYSVGAADAILLDRVNPGWKRRYFTQKFSLDGLFARQGTTGS